MSTQTSSKEVIQLEETFAKNTSVIQLDYVL